MDLIAMENRYLELRRKADDIHEEMERAPSLHVHTTKTKLFRTPL